MPRQVASHERAGYAPATRETCTNIGQTERIVSALAGGAMTLLGVARGNASGAALALLGGGLLFRGVTGHCYLYDSLGIDTAQEARGRATAIAAGHGVRVEQSIVIERPAGEVYEFWRELSNLAQFMEHLESVKTDGDRSHWVAKSPLGATVEWDAEIINQRENELLAWRSLPGSEVETAGSVHFTPTSTGGVEITVNLKYNPPGGKLGADLARLLGEYPDRQIAADLQRLKQLLESGEPPRDRQSPVTRRAK